MAEHALLSPSAAHRWITCHGSVAMESRFKPKTNDSAEYGTACHELSQWALTEKRDAADYLGQKTTNGTTIDKPMADLCQIYIDNLRDYADGHTLLVEQRVDFSSCIGVPDQFGTSDGIIIAHSPDWDELQVHDLKTGYHIVHARRNPQLMLYALGALHELGILGDFSRFRFVIHQPSRDHLDEWDCTLAELMSFAQEAKEAAQNALKALKAQRENKDISAFLNPANDACQWCKAAATCPVLAQSVSTTIGAEFEDLTKCEVRALVPQDPSKLAVKMQATDLIEHWIKAVRSEVERELLCGTAVPGYKLVRGKQGNRRWLDEKETIKTFKSLKLSKDQIYNFHVISPTDAEKLLKIAPDKWTQVAPLITRSEGALSVAPLSDKREAIIVSAIADAFEDLTGSDLI